MGLTGYEAIPMIDPSSMRLGCPCKRRSNFNLEGPLIFWAADQGRFGESIRDFAEMRRTITWDA